MDMNLSDKKYLEKDYIQEKLMYELSKYSSKFFSQPEIMKLQLDEGAEFDILSGALITLATKNIAYSAVTVKEFHGEIYMNSIFDAMRLMFIKQHRILKADLSTLKSSDGINLEFH